jgi:hypothetical protein
MRRVYEAVVAVEKQQVLHRMKACMCAREKACVCVCVWAWMHGRWRVLARV